MSKIAREAVDLGFRLTENDVRLLKRVSALSEAGFDASNDRLAAELGVSVSTIRLSLRRLNDLGLVKTQPRYLPNGGCLENHHAMTKVGKDLLAKMEKPLLCMV